MVIVTPAALAKLGALIVEHPEDPVVRLTIIDRDDDRIVFGITLESAARPDDVVQEYNGLTIATEARSAARMDGVTLWITESRAGFDSSIPIRHLLKMVPRSGCSVISRRRG